ncbi:MAG: aminopeptidase P family protein [Elusimicrobia bacterium]|nr:aminopeptidase P family protein [Elusimicrobiota bacterium]
MREIERRKADFDLSRLLKARERTLQAVAEIAGAMKAGMPEEDAYGIAKAVLAEMGAEKHWHRPWIRFGPNTTKLYGELSAPGCRLGPDDIFFVDIGPVWGGYEGDAGDTFTTGSNAEFFRCRDGARRIFDAVSKRWRQKSLAGRALYEFARKKADELGWALNLRANGHCLSDFPHALYYKGGLAEVSFAPSPHAWVLEIQIRHPSREFGAFYEDLLF